MSDDPRVLELLAEMLDSGATPDEVCRSCPELLARVREEWREVCRARADVDVLFPPFREPRQEAARSEGTPLPTIAGYEIEAVIGHGGMGVAFRARHLRLNRVVALKMMLAGEYASLHERERFQREAEAVAGLRHPNVVQLYDVGECDGRAFFTMEYVEGGSLARELNGTPRRPREAATLLATLAGAVHAAHVGGIVHRDLKPSNVLLTADGTPKIGDFGLARRRGDGAGLTRTGAAIGTPSYMAPEQAAGARTAADPAVDVYALGAVLYELLTGRPPFRAETAAETIQQVLSLDPVPPSRRNPKTPRDLEIICLKCLHKEPGSRYADAASLGEDLGRFLRGEAITARPEGRLERLTRRIRRRPALSATLVLGSLLTVGVAGGGLWLLSERAVATRRIAAEQAAAERAADASLRDMARSMQTASWAEASVALDRAKAWLGALGSDELKRRVDQGGRDLALAARLDAIRLTGYKLTGDRLDFTRADEEYEIAFRDAGLGHMGEPPSVVATRVKASDLRNTLLAALDSWSFWAKDPRRQHWALDVAEQADGDTTGWRARARAPATWKDEAALLKLISAAPAPEQSAALLTAVAFVAPVERELRLKFMMELRETHPRDFWVNLDLATSLTSAGKHAEAIGYYRAALAIRPGAAPAHLFLGISLVHVGQVREALARFHECAELDSYLAATAHGYAANALLQQRRYAEAMAEARAAIRLGPAPLDHTVLGVCLEAENRPAEALDHHRRAVTLDPKHRRAQNELRAILLRLGRADELHQAWEASLAANPPEHDDWYGYAELCLFQGREEEYRRARRSLLAKFGATTDPRTAERTGRACLLRPLAGDELIAAVALADRVAAVDRNKSQGISWAFQFVKGLAEYRQGHFERAISTMKGEASVALVPAPQFVIAMAQHKSERFAEARTTLAAAISAYDWRPDRVRNQDDWIIHVLRREAESLVVPELPALLNGTRSPRDNDERLAMLGSFQFAGRFRDTTRLYADAFAADPKLVGDLVAAHRFNAARFAALAGRGLGATGETIGLPERERLRAQAREWLRGELESCRSALKLDPKGHRHGVRIVLDRCRGSKDLAGLREPNELEKLPPVERKECVALWNDVGDVTRQLDGLK